MTKLEQEALTGAVEGIRCARNRVKELSHFDFESIGGSQIQVDRICTQLDQLDDAIGNMLVHLVQADDVALSANMKASGKR